MAICARAPSEREEYFVVDMMCCLKSVDHGPRLFFLSLGMLQPSRELYLIQPQSVDVMSGECVS